MISATLSIRKCKYYVLFKVFESLACREVGGKFKIMTRQFFPFRTQTSNLSLNYVSRNQSHTDTKSSLAFRRR